MKYFHVLKMMTKKKCTENKRRFDRLKHNIINFYQDITNLV